MNEEVREFKDKLRELIAAHSEAMDTNLGFKLVERVYIDVAWLESLLEEETKRG